MTLLFADIVGSTGTQEQMDPESVRRGMDRFYAAMRAAVEGHGGRIVKFIGDGVMAAFGVPDVREDDARRALAAASAMQDAFANLGDSANVALRVGINTGEVVVSADDDDVVGDAVNVAARLEQAAGPGEVVVGESTWRLVRFTARLRALPPLDLKGKAEPVHAFQLISLEPAVDASTTTPFIGRTAELGRLLTVLDDAIRSRRARLVTIVGSPGVGKTRLARELRTAAAARARVIEMRCDPAAGQTFGPLAEALRSAASLDEEATPETIVAALAALLDEDEPDRDRIAARAGALLGAGEPGLPEETFWAVRRLVENTARVQPVVMFFDDIHWAEPLLLDFVDHLVEWIRDAPVLLVATARPEVREVRPALVEEGGRVSAVIHLEGLPVEESRRLACELLGAAALPEPLLERLATTSEGNPLFVGELVRMLVDDGALRRQGNEWIATVDLQEIELPLTIHALLGARIDRIGVGERAVLEVASVIGKTFYRGAVAELVAPEVRADLDALLEQLRRKELIDSTGTYWIDEPVLRFHHVLIRDAAYRRLLKESRAELHERTAQWFATKVGDLVEHDDVIGYQLERAYELRFEAGDINRDLGRRAAARLAAAGRRALEADDRSAAASLIGRAIDCLDAEDPERAALLIDQCEALLAAGDVNGAVPAVAALERLAEGSQRLEAWAECFAGELANMTDPGHLADTAVSVANASTRFAALGDVAGEAKARSVQAASLMRLGRIGECEATLDKALAAARQAGDRRREAGALAGVPVAVLWGPNSVTRASGRCLDIVRVLRITSRAPAVEATSLRCQAVLESLRGRVDAGRRMLATARASLQELGNAHGLLELDLAAGMVETIAGDHDAAETHLRRAHDGFATLGIDVDAGFAAALLARVAVARAAFDDAVELTIESEKRGGDDLKTAIAWRAVRAEALAHAGQLLEARALAEEAVALAEPTDALLDHADALMAMATVMRVSRDDRTARSYAQRALELFDRKEASAMSLRVREFLGHGEAPTSRVEPSSTVTELRTPENAATRAVRRSDEFSAVEPLLTRGERLALVQAFIRVEDDRSSAETYQVVEVDDAGRITSKIPFNADQLDAATAELDQRYMASLPQPDVWVPAMQYVRAINARDWGLLRAHLTDDFVGVDHRPLGWGTLDADHFVDLYRSAVELAPDVWGGLLAVHAITASGCCVRAELRGTTSDGATFRTSATIVLFVSDAKWTGTAFFPEEQPERAMALLEGRDAATAILENAASRVAFSRVGFRGSVVAVRGRSLCLLHSTVVADGADSEILEVVEIDADGRLARGDVFDADQLDEAFALLDKRFIAGEARPYASAWSVTVELQRGLSDHDVARALSYTADDMPFEDHRPVGWGLLSRMEWARLYPPVFEQSPDVTWRIIADCDVSPHVAFVHFEMRGTRADGGAFISPMLGLFNIVDGLCRRIDIYVPEDLAAAEARFAELAAAHAELENDASRVAFSGVGYQGSVVAVRGRRLCLLHSTVTEVGRDSEVLEVVEIDDTHCVTRRIVFDCEHRDEAFALLDERFLAGEAAPFASTWRGGLAVVDGMNRHDLDAIRAATNDDVVLHDHRLVGWGSLEKDEYLALYPSIYDEVPDVRWLVLRELGLSERGAFAELDMCGTRPDGGTVSSPRLSVFEVRDGRCSRLDIYSPEDRAAAERRFAELTGAQAVFENAASRLGAATIARMFEGDWEGLARLFSDDVVIRDHRPLVGGADVLGRAAATNGLRTLVELGVTEFSHRVLAVRGQRLCLTHSTVNAGDSGDEVLELDELDESGLEIRSDTFAYDQLDEAFALLDERFLAGEGAAHATKWRVLTEIADAMNRRDLDAIRNLVTRDFTMVDHRPASLGTASVDEWFAMFPVLYERSADVRWWTLADCRMSEHAVLRIHESRGTTREGGGEFSSPYYLVSEFRGDAPCRNDFYPLEEAAAAEARFAEIIDAANELANDATRAAAAHSDVVAIRGEHLCLVRHGDVLQLIETDDSGRVAGTDDFDPQQLDEAIALLDERFIAVLEPRCGAAWRAKARAVRAMNERDLSALRESMTPDLVLVDHRPLSFGTIGRDEYVRLFPPMWEQSPHVRWTMVRDHGVGERVACFLLGISGSTHEGGRFDIPVWNVITERDGLLARMEAFPDVAAASQRYDELVEAEADRALANAATRAVPTPHEVLAIRGDRLALTRSQADGHEVVRLTELDHLGALARHEDFEADELDAAYELLDERFLERLPTEGNGWRAWARAVRAMNARDLDGLRAAMTEDLVFVDHRALSFGTIDRERYLTLFPPMWDQSPDVRWTMVSDHGVGDHAACLFFRIHGTTNDGGLFDSPVWVIATDRDGLLAHMEAFPTADEATRRFDELVEAESGQTLANAATRVALTPHQVIAVRGDRLALTRSRAGGELPGHETLLVTELDPQGALVRNDAFQLEQLDAAVALLEERFLASLGAGGAGWAVLVRMIDAANRRSLDDLRNGMSEDFEIVDHRPLSLGTVDRDHYVASMKAMWDQSADTRFTVLCDHGVSASVVCFFVRVHGTTNDGGLFDNILWMTVVERDGKVAHMEDFLTREEAVARFAELAASPEPGLANAATRMAAAPHEVLALRGERLALTRSLLDGHEVLQLIELDEQGVLARSETFEMDHLAHALVELDERFLEGIDVQGGAWRAIARATEAMTRRDLDGVRSAMTEDFVFVDHRPLSFGTVDRERYLRLLAPLFDETPDVRWTMVSNHGITDHIACGLIRHSGTTNEGGRFDNPVWGVISERDQLWSRVEAFTTREEAVACFAELANARSDGLNNAATRAVAGAPEVLALRGDRLALTRTRADSHEIFRLTEVDASGAMTRNESFGVDQLDEAIARLEELFLAGEGAGNAAWATMAVVMAAVNARDLDALRALMTDDLLITDHRPLGWGTIGVDGFIGVHAALYEESDDARWTMIRDLRLSHDTICVQNQTAGTSEHGSDFVMGLVGVVVTRDGRMASMEAFPADDVAAALARFVELTADEPFGARNGSKANPVGGAT